MPSVEAELARRLAHGEELVVATVIKLDGDPPSQTGSKLLMSTAAGLAGTLGCSEFDSAALADAAGIARSGAPQLRTYRHDLGSIDVYLEPYAATPTLVVIAATPVAEALLRWAPEVGFRPVLVETRPERLAGGDWPDAVTSLGSLQERLAGDVYVVHTDHDAHDMVQALEAVLSANPRFIGLVGSRRHTGHHLEALRAKGVPAELIERIQSPVGLDVGGRTPQEIALSILAGVVAVRHGAGGGWKQGSTIG
ncbi:MAG: XdhC family protein [Candidatus Dormibacteraceae bacterium]